MCGILCDTKTTQTYTQVWVSHGCWQPDDVNADWAFTSITVIGTENIQETCQEIHNLNLVWTKKTVNNILERHNQQALS